MLSKVAAWTLLVALALPFGQALTAPTILDEADDQAGGPPGTEPSGDLILGDAAQDVQVLIAWRAGVPAQNASQFGDRFDHLDIYRVVIGGENESYFRVEFHVKALERQDANNPWRWDRSVRFDYGKLGWRVSDRPCFNTPSATNVGCLYRREPSLGFEQGTAVARETLPGNAGYAFVLAKKQIFSELRVPARFGDTLQNISAWAAETYFEPNWFIGWNPFVQDPVGGVGAWDGVMKDGQLAAFQFAKGGAKTDDLLLNTPYPVRVSNGEATTFVYPVTVSNFRSETLQVRLEAADLPEDWNIRVPAVVRVPASGSLNVPVIAGVPFTHIHGATRTFNVTAERVDGVGGVARLQLGVLWTEIPQPSAHHQGKLWLHSRAPTDPYPPWTTLFPMPASWMNGIDRDPTPGTTEQDVASYNNWGLVGNAFSIFGGTPTVPPQNTADWEFPLAPSLLLGLDFDRTQAIQTKFRIVPTVSTSNANVSAVLMYCNPLGGQAGAQDCSGRFGFFGTQWEPVAGGGVTAAITGGTSQEFEVPLTIDPRYDYIPYRYGANLMLVVILTTDIPQNVFSPVPVTPMLVVAGSMITLPLHEYHDPIDQAFQNVGAISLEIKGLRDKPMNPGKTAVFTFELASNSAKRERLALDIEGTNKQWATLRSPEFVTLERGQTQVATVTVQVPDPVGTDERADLYLTATSVDDPAVVAATRFVTTVVTGQVIPDESALVAGGPSGEKTPAVPWVGLVAAVVLVALVMRRRALR